MALPSAATRYRICVEVGGGQTKLQIGFAADELPVHYRGGVGKSEKGRVKSLDLPTQFVVSIFFTLECRPCRVLLAN